MRIDSHQHFWRYSAAEYAWIDDAMSVIRRDFLPTDLAPELARAGVNGCVAVQARQSLAETEWLLQLATQHPLVKGVVGWLPLAEARAEQLAERLSASSVFKGARHVVQAEPDGFLDHPEFNRGIKVLTKLGLTYDILIFARQLEEAIRFVDRHPQQTFVLDHIAKPRVAGSPDETWTRLMVEMAKRPNVVCKISGMVTEAPGWRWTPSTVQPYVDVVLQAFGPKRLMYGSDWPVCLVATTYQQWHATVKGCISRLSADECHAIFGGTARSIYKLA
jgi:L-fuconolactonase